jgi:hypothetical protein
MPKRSPQTNEKPNFIFKGTIKKIKSATMSEVPLSDRTAIVKVDEVIDGPKDLQGSLGQEITVELSSKRAARAGQSMIFHTVGWIFGAGVAVRSLREEPIKPGSATKSTTRVKRGADMPVTKGRHFSDADLVVAGTVVNVRIPAVSPQARKRTALPSPITEHDPVWREAVIKVSDVLKGEKTWKQVTVRFPDSSDVMFHGVPKFEPGQEGYFMLHRGEGAKSTVGRAQKSKSADTYFALDAQDFQPFEK